MHKTGLSDCLLDELVAFATHLADTARAHSLPLFRAGIDVANKKHDGFDPVTMADKNTEVIIRKLIEQTYPQHGIMGEEYGIKDTDSPFRWVVDPVDGTRAFIAGAPTWTTLIALEFEGVSALGVIDQPFTGERWVGVVGRSSTWSRDGATLSCQTRSQDDIEQAVVATTDPRAGVYFSVAEAAAFAALSSRSKLSLLGCDAYAYGLLASGHVDLVIEAGLAHYDAAALLPVVQAAGGKVTDWRAEAITPEWSKPLIQGGQGGRIIAAANTRLHDQACNILQNCTNSGQ